MMSAENQTEHEGLSLTGGDERQKEAAKFLDRDFNQCFQQMRHYDGQTLDICKFAFTAYAAIIGGALALYQYGVEKGIDYTTTAVGLLGIATLFGLILLGLVVRNRVYFVLVTRYINEHREFFLATNPLGFANRSRMYTNPSQPPYFSKLSSQAFLMYLLGALNATILGIAVFLIWQNKACAAFYVGATVLTVFAVQTVSAVVYLRTRENKSASAALWGKTKGNGDSQAESRG